jgi:choline dehydrogenase
VVSYDHIVIGGGTAGSVVAARLSEDRDRRVLLLEAGPDYPDEIPAELLDARSTVLSGHNWDLQAIVSEEDTGSLTEQQARIAMVFQRAASRLGPGAGSPQLPALTGGAVTRFKYPMGKVMGGGSAVNGGFAFHARPEDYAVWAELGNGRWSWDKVRPAIDRIDGADGGKPALSMEALTEAPTRFQAAFLEACLAMGHPRVDLRPGTAAGVGVIPRSLRRGERVSSARLYLEAARQRPNLVIRPHCLVDKLLFEPRNGGLTASGVEALVDGRQCRFSGGQIVLSAGSIYSPAILMRSGVGAAAEVARAGGTPLLDLPGVGKNLIDHPAVSIWAVPRPGACVAGEQVHQMLLQQRSTGAASLCDLQLFMLSAVATEKLPPLRDVVGSDLAVGITAVVATPDSRGRVELLDCDPAHHPRIYLNCLKETSDLRRMMEGVRSAWSIMRGEQLGSNIERIVMWNQSIIESDLLMERMMRSTVRSTWHAVGTLRMGREGEATAVVDQYGRLYGCSNVTVADASIMPAIPSVPPSLTCMLIAERIAAHLRGKADDE